jgi:hypothetical protein
MEVYEVVKFSDSFLSIASGLFLRQNFSQSADLSARILAKLCKENSSNKAIAYKNAVFISLANNDLDVAVKIKDLGKTCSIQDNVVSEVSLEVLKDLGKARRWETYEATIKELSTNPKNHPALIKPFEDLRKELVAIGNTEEARQIFELQNKYFQDARSQKLDLPVEALDLIAERMLVGVVEKKQRLSQLPLSFPENVFNNTVKTKLQILDQMTTEVNNIQKIGSGKAIVEAYKYVVEAYEEFGIALQNFVPEGKGPAYVDSFKKAMTDVHGPILNNARKQRTEIKKLIIENKILSYSNYNVLFPDLEKFKRYFAEKEAVLMERGGRK